MYHSSHLRPHSLTFNKRKANLLKEANPNKKKINPTNHGSDSSDELDDSNTVYRIKNHIYFRDDVTQESVTKLEKLIIAVNHEYQHYKMKHSSYNIEPNPIYLHITSYGGYIYAGFIAVNAIKASKIPIYTVVDGHAMSCGSLMFVAGKKRLMSPNAVLLIHQLSGSSSGKYKEMQDDMHNSDIYMNMLSKIYLDNSTDKKLTKKELDSLFKSDLYLDFKKSYSIGLADSEYLGE